MSVTISKPLKNTETGKWEVERDGEVFEFDSRKEAKDFSEGGEAVPAPAPTPVAEEEDEDEDEDEDEGLNLPEASSVAAQAVTLIVGAGRSLGNKIRGLVGDLGKTEVEILNHLEAGGMSQKDLAKRIGTASTNVGQAIARLEDADMVESKRSKTDRRSFDIYLTEKGRLMKTEVVAKREAAVNSVFANLNENELTSLINILRKLF
jgi:DNA-binding MarR family transcriptional regulator